MTADLIPGPSIEEWRNPKWAMTVVPESRWRDFTDLRHYPSLVMWTQSDLLGDDGIDKWAEYVGANGYGQGYPVVLGCMDCEVQEVFEASMDDDTALDNTGKLFVLEGLDERMCRFVERHAGCYWQTRMAI